MIEPYESVIATEHPKLQTLGFERIENSDYSTVFSDGDHNLQFITELQYPSLAINLVDKTGKTRALHLIQKVLAPAAAISDREKFAQMRAAYKIDSTPVIETMRDGRLFEYTRLLADTLLDFLIAFRGPILEQPSYKQEYDAGTSVVSSGLVSSGKIPRRT